MIKSFDYSNKIVFVVIALFFCNLYAYSGCYDKKDTTNTGNMYLFQAPIEQYNIECLEEKLGKPAYDTILTISESKKNEDEFEILSIVENKLYKKGNILRYLSYKMEDNTTLNITFILESNVWCFGSYYIDRDIMQDDTLLWKPYLNYTFERLVGILGEPLFDSNRDSVYLTEEELPRFFYSTCERVTGRLRRTAWNMGKEYVLILFAECYDCVWKPYSYYIGNKIVERNF